MTATLPPPVTMRTLQIGDDWIAEREGGLARYFAELIRTLPGTGTTAQGLVVGSERVAALTHGQIVALGAPDAPMMKRMRSARRLALEQIDGGKVDLIASHFALYALPIADRLRRIPTVVHFHGPWAAESGAEGSAGLGPRFKRSVEKAVYTRARRLIVLSESFKQELMRNYAIDEGLIRIVPGGIDSDRFNMQETRAEARTRLGWPLDRPIVLCVRRQVRRMGLEDLIDAVKVLVVKQPDLLVLLGGSGPIVGELKARIEAHGLEQHVRQLGRVSDEDLPTAYRAADMTVVPSQALEGFGLITLESLAAGTPVYVTPVGGLPEIVRPFAPQCVFTGTSSGEIAAGLGAALSGASVVPGDGACRGFAEGFAWPRIAARVRGVYDEALG